MNVRIAEFCNIRLTITATCESLTSATKRINYKFNVKFKVTRQTNSKVQRPDSLLHPFFCCLREYLLIFTEEKNSSAKQEFNFIVLSSMFQTCIKLSFNISLCYIKLELFSLQNEYKGMELEEIRFKIEVLPLSAHFLLHTL